MKRKAWLSIAYALLIAFAVLLFCSKASPLYPINDWADANIYLSIGKGMTQGRVAYRDLYDHKGPLLYALHALCAWVSYADFTGVFGMEVLLAAAFLALAQRLLERGGAGNWAWALTPVLALAVYTSLSFAEGDSAEEMALPLVTASLLSLWTFLANGGGRMKRGALLGNGVLAGCVFWIKFTMIGLHAGLFMTLAAYHLARREVRETLRAVGWLAVGFALSTLPWIVYFGMNGAIGDWLKTYLYDNLFLYGGEAGGLLHRAKGMLRCGWEWFAHNAGCSALMVLGLAACGVRAARQREVRWCAAACWLMAALGALGTFVGGKAYVYYGLALAPCCVPGLLAVGRSLSRCRTDPRRAAAAACALCVALTPVLSPNPRPVYGAAMGEKREDTMQYRIAAQISEKDASLLNYGFMDAGFFTAAGLTPQVKYFHQTNVPLQEMKDEQRRYIREGLCDYVVARGELPEGGEAYEPVITVESPNFWYDTVTLYRRKKGVD